MTDQKSVWRRSGSVSRMLLPLLLLALSGASCSILEAPPSSLPDYDNRDRFILDFKVGDRFETLKPMFLTRPVGTYYSIAKPGIGAPSTEQYGADPGRFRYVVRMLQPGTAIELVGIKDGGFQTVAPYVKLEGMDEWIGIGLCEYTKVGGRHHKQYDREYFRKVGDATNAVPLSAPER